MHSMSTLTVSRERQKPASSIVKPTCMPKTRNAATNVHVVLIGLTILFPVSSGGGAGAAASADGVGTAASAALAPASGALTSSSAARAVDESNSGLAAIK